MKQTVVIVDPLTSGALFKKKAKDKGYNVVGVFTLPMWAAEEAFHGDSAQYFADCDTVIESSNPKDILEQLKQMALNLKGVFAASESGVETAEILAKELGLPGNEPSSARRNKYEMRERVKNAGLASPLFRRCTSLEEVEEFALKKSYPLVMKTPEGAGTQNVYICEDLEDLKNRFFQVLSSANIYGSVPTFALVEEYVGGLEYIVDLFSDGEEVHVTDVWVYEKGRASGPKNLCWNCMMIPQKEAKEVVEYAKKVAKALKIDIGPSHAEIKNDPIKGPMLIEIGARLCGAGLPQLISEASNFNIYDASLEIYTSSKPPVPKEITSDTFFAISFGIVFDEGLVEKIEGIDEIQKLPSYLKHNLFLKVGDPVKKSVDLLTTPLFVYLSNKDRVQLKKDVEAIHNLFKVSVK